MPIINHKHFATVRRAEARRRRIKPLLYGVGALLACTVMLNLGMAIAYNGRALPRYTLGQMPVGGMSYKKLSEQMSAGRLLPEKLTLQKGDMKRVVATSDLGVRADVSRSVQALKDARTWLPMASLFVPHTVPVSATVDDAKYSEALAGLTPLFSADAQPSHITFDGTDFKAQNPADGYKLNADALKRAARTAAAEGNTIVNVPATVVPKPAATDLSAEVDSLKQQLALKLSFNAGGTTTQVDRRTIGRWYVPDGQTMRPSAEQVTKYVNALSAEAANSSDLVHAVRYVLRKGQDATFVVAPKGSPVRTYCTSTRGATNSSIDDLIGKLAATYADPRGWGIHGRMAFQHVASGCEFTVWLGAPDQMTSFGEICDSYYSCQVGTNVIINDDRWNKATDPWVAAGASIEDYRTLVINHETGHRLGFLDNNTCDEPGSPAPVMMQQSIDLHGCAFNRWPTTTELNVLRAQNGL